MLALKKARFGNRYDELKLLTGNTDLTASVERARVECRWTLEQHVYTRRRPWQKLDSWKAAQDAHHTPPRLLKRRVSSNGANVQPSCSAASSARTAIGSLSCISTASNPPTPNCNAGFDRSISTAHSELSSPLGLEDPPTGIGRGSKSIEANWLEADVTEAYLHE
jgi:hypothetical protein